MMKCLILCRILPALLYMTVVFDITACGEQNQLPKTEESCIQSIKEIILSRSKGTNESRPLPQVNSKPEEAALVLLRNSMAYSDQIAGAVAYLGFREQSEKAPLPEWLRENCAGLVSEMPFLLDIPAERVLGAGWGDLYCIVPRDENTSLAVNHVTWESLGNGVWPVPGEVLYREECAQPVLIFVNYEQWRDEPDTEIVLVTNDGVEVKWLPLTDEYGIPIVPTGEDYIPMLMDFGIWGYVTGLDYSGRIDLYHQPEDGQEYAYSYSGIWRMEGDCLYLDLSDGAGTRMSGSFPVLIDPSGESLHIQQDRETGVCPPFFGEGMTCMDLIRAYG